MYSCGHFDTGVLAGLSIQIEKAEEAEKAKEAKEAEEAQDAEEVKVPWLVSYGSWLQKSRSNHRGFRGQKGGSAE